MDKVKLVFGTRANQYIALIVIFGLVTIAAVAQATTPGYHDFDFGPANMHSMVVTLAFSLASMLTMFFVGQFVAIERIEKDVGKRIP